MKANTYDREDMSALEMIEEHLILLRSLKTI